MLGCLLSSRSMKKTLIYGVLGLVSVALVSCSGALSEKQKAAITSISVTDHEELKGAKKAVNGGKSPGAADSLPMVTGGGALPALLGSAIDAGVVSVQKSNFKKQYASEIERLNAVAYPKIADAIEEKGISVLKRDDFFGPKWTDQAGAHYFDGEITTYGLQRRERKKGETYLEAMVGLNVWLVSDGKKLFTAPMTVVSENAYTTSEFADKPELLRKVFVEAVSDFENQFDGLLNKKLGRK